jgi:hypothetical protein
MNEDGKTIKLTILELDKNYSEITPSLNGQGDGYFCTHI